MLPANPTARVGERHRLILPIRHGSRLRRRRLRKQQLELSAPW